MFEALETLCFEQCYSQRGEHNINDELVFSSNKGFVFHDSCGFEAGSTEEVNAMQEFLSKRATANTLDKKVHAIWCVENQLSSFCKGVNRSAIQVLHTD
jgi:hypothetical protein